MATKKNVSIKGTKDGLTFFLNDNCSIEEIGEELKDILNNSHNDFLNGPLMRVTIKTGCRKLSEDQQEIVKGIFKIKGNLFIQSFETECDFFEEMKDHAKIVTGIIRSGQIYEVKGNILLIGDVHPGGNILATGNIYILGSLKGMAHGGIGGNKDAYVAASTMGSSQLRIADKILSTNNEKILNNNANIDNHDLIAYIEKRQIVIDTIQSYFKRRKAIGTF